MQYEKTDTHSIKTNGQRYEDKSHSIYKCQDIIIFLSLLSHRVQSCQEPTANCLPSLRQTQQLNTCTSEREGEGA